MEIMLQNGNFSLTKCTYIAGIQKNKHCAKEKYSVRTFHVPKTGKFP
jgi:hypothetical protein